MPVARAPPRPAAPVLADSESARADFRTGRVERAGARGSLRGRAGARAAPGPDRSVHRHRAHRPRPRPRLRCACFRAPGGAVPRRPGVRRPLHAAPLRPAPG
eukprot:8586675-Alexandrium_andersonii.AAC.1